MVEATPGTTSQVIIARACRMRVLVSHVVVPDERRGRPAPIAYAMKTINKIPERVKRFDGNVLRTSRYAPRSTDENHVSRSVSSCARHAVSTVPDRLTTTRVVLRSPAVRSTIAGNRPVTVRARSGRLARRRLDASPTSSAVRRFNNTGTRRVLAKPRRAVGPRPSAPKGPSRLSHVSVGRPRSASTCVRNVSAQSPVTRKLRCRCPNRERLTIGQSSLARDDDSRVVGDR